MRIAIIAAVTVTLLPLAQALADDSSFDSIVRDLTNTNTYDSRPEREHDSLDQIRFHVSAGMVTSQLSLDLPAGLPSSETMHGYEVGLGIDLFSPTWQAQFDIRSFEPDDFGDNSVSLREFDLLLVHQSLITGQLYWNIGAGLAARYLSLKTPVTIGGDDSFSTPASVLTTGVAYAFTPNFSVDIMASLRTRLVENTPDAGSIDGTIHLTGHF